MHNMVLIWQICGTLRYLKKSVQQWSNQSTFWDKIPYHCFFVVFVFSKNIASLHGKSISLKKGRYIPLQQGRYIHTVHYIRSSFLVRSRTEAVSRVSISFLRDHFGRHHLHTAVNCLVNYRAGVIKTDLYITRSGECVCLVNLIKQQVQNQVIWLWCAPCENDNQTKILIWAAFTYFCMGVCTLPSPCSASNAPPPQKSHRIQMNRHL